MEQEISDDASHNCSDSRDIFHNAVKKRVQASPRLKSVGHGSMK